MNIKHFFILSLLFFNMSVFSFAQQREYTAKSGKAVKHFERGEKFYYSKLYDEAEGELKDAIKADSNFIEAHMVLAAVYDETNKKEKAIKEYKSAVRINPDFFPENLYDLAKAEMEMSQYEDAVMHLEKYLVQKNGDKPRSDTLVTCGSYIPSGDLFH